MFKILVVDDDPGAVQFLRELMQHLKHKHELHFVRDGVEALNYLHGRGAYVNVPRPNLILLDIAMPRLSGLETLAAIKGDPELRVIPVIMLSTSDSPQDVRTSYQAHANCFVQKPMDLDRSIMLVQATEAFWMDFAILTPSYGPAIAYKPVEARSQARNIADSPAKGSGTRSSDAGCEEHARLLDEFGTEVKALQQLHDQQFLAISGGDPECHRFDLLIHMANEKKHLAKYAYIRHVEAHGCSNTNAFDKTRA